VTSPADVHAIAERVYRVVAPQLRVHVLCREFALIVCGVAAALGVEHELVCEATHYFVRFEARARYRYPTVLGVAEVARRAPHWTRYARQVLGEIKTIQGAARARRVALRPGTS
jgi:hypothetical protein